MSHFFRSLFRFWPLLKQTMYLYWNRLYFRLIGIKFGKRMVVHNKVYVIGHGSICIGDNFHFTSGDCLNPISRNIRGVFFTIFPSSVIEIGNNVGISSSCIWAKERVKIGENVNIGADCIIMDNDAHPVLFSQRRPEYQMKEGLASYNEHIQAAPIVIDDDVWVGARCLILKGVHIGKRSVIGAGSVVTKDIPSDCVAAGNPCRVLRYLSEKER